MPIRIPIFSILIYLLFSAGIVAETHPFRCRAQDPQSRKTVFTCLGYENVRNGKPVYAEITYRLPQGKVFAREKINFRKSTVSPDFSLSDERDGRREMVEHGSAGFNLLMQENAKAAPEFIRLQHSQSETAITIPGIPQFISQNWEKVTAGEKTIFYCAFPAQKKLLRLRAQYTGTVKYGRHEAISLRLQPDNFVYRWFSEPVYLTIRKSDRRLLRYQGLHYIRDPRTGGGSIVDLTFSW